MSSDDELKNGCASNQIFSSIKATVNREWEANVPKKSLDKVFEKLEEIGIRIEWKSKHFVLMGTLDQIKAAERKLATCSVQSDNRTGPCIVREVISRDQIVEDGNSPCTAEELRHCSMSSFETVADEIFEKSRLECNVQKDVENMGSMSNDEDSNGIIVISHDVSVDSAEHCDEERVMSEYVFEQESIDESIAGPVSGNRDSVTIEMPINQDGFAGEYVIIQESPMKKRAPDVQERKWDLSCDRIIWDYIEAMGKLPSSFLQELGIMLRREDQGDVSFVELQPVILDDISFDLELLDAAHHQLVQLYMDVQSDCVVEQCKISLDNSLSEQLLKEIQRTFKNVLARKCLAKNVFEFVGPAKDAHRARRDFKQKAHTVGTFQGIRLKSSPVDEPKVRSMQSSRYADLQIGTLAEKNDRLAPESDLLLDNRNEAGSTASQSLSFGIESSSREEVRAEDLPVEPCSIISRVNEVKINNLVRDHASGDHMFQISTEGKPINLGTQSDPSITDERRMFAQEKNTLNKGDGQGNGVVSPNVPRKSQTMVYNRSEPEQAEQRCRVAKIDAGGISYGMQQCESVNTLVEKTNQDTSKLPQKSEPRVRVTSRKLPTPAIVPKEDAILETKVCNVTVNSTNDSLAFGNLSVHSSGKIRDAGLQAVEFHRNVTKKHRQRMQFDSSSDDEAVDTNEQKTSRLAARVTFKLPSAAALPVYKSTPELHASLSRPARRTRSPVPFTGHQLQNEQHEITAEVESLLECRDEAALAALLERMTGKSPVEPVRTVAAASPVLSDEQKEVTGYLSSDADEDFEYGASNIPGRNESHQHETQSTLSPEPQPEGGSFVVIEDKKVHLTGFEGQGTIATTINFSSGVEQNHPEKSYLSLTLTFYLPASGDGREAHRLMKQAFDSRQLFRVLYKDSEIGKLVPNDVELKTEMASYPDSGYLPRVVDRLREILDDDCR